MPFLGKLACPNCRHETTPPTSVQDFPIDSRAQKSEEERSFCETKEEETREPCKSCEDEDTAWTVPAAYCEECGGGICPECVEQHSKIKALKKHKYVNWNDFCVDTLKPSTAHRICHVHKLQTQLFCEQCNHFACSLCLKDRHKMHLDSAKPLEEVSKKRICEVREMQRKAEQRLDDCTKQLESLRQMHSGVEAYPKSLEMSINYIFDEYMQKLTVWREQKISEVRDVYSQMMKTIKCQQEEMDNARGNLSTGIQTAKKATSCTEDEEIIEMSGKAIEQLKTTLQACNIELLKRPLVFEKADIRFGRLRELEDGDIRVEPPSFCFMNTPNDIKVSFTLPVHTRPEVRILYGSQKQCSVVLHPSTPIIDQCMVVFHPRVAGKHTIEVWVGGVKCKCCDDAMIVRGAPEIESSVKPGPDWDGDDNVCRGTVLSSEQLPLAQRFPVLELVYGESEQESFELKVQWDNGEVVEYQWGNNDEYVFELVDHQKSDPNDVQCHGGWLEKKCI